MKKFYVYILYSQNAARYYCGQTDDLEKRLCQHNDSNNPFTKTTHRFSGLWQIVWKKAFESRSEAIIMERSIKKHGIKRFFEKNSTGGC